METQVVLLRDVLNLVDLHPWAHLDIENILPSYFCSMDFSQKHTDKISDLETISIVKNNRHNWEMLVADFHVIGEPLVNFEFKS